MVSLYASGGRDVTTRVPLPNIKVQFWGEALAHFLARPKNLVRLVSTRSQVLNCLIFCLFIIVI